MTTATELRSRITECHRDIVKSNCEFRIAAIKRCIATLKAELEALEAEMTETNDHICTCSAEQLHHVGCDCAADHFTHVEVRFAKTDSGRYVLTFNGKVRDNPATFDSYREARIAAFSWNGKVSGKNVYWCAA